LAARSSKRRRTHAAVGWQSTAVNSPLAATFGVLTHGQISARHGRVLRPVRGYVSRRRFFRPRRNGQAVPAIVDDAAAAHKFPSGFWAQFWETAVSIVSARRNAGTDFVHRFCGVRIHLS